MLNQSQVNIPEIFWVEFEKNEISLSSRSF